MNPRFYRDFHSRVIGFKPCLKLPSFSLVNEKGYDRLVVFKLDEMLNLFIEDQSLEFSGPVRDFQLFSFGNNKYLIVLMEEKLQLFASEGASFIPRPSQRLIECGNINGLHVFVHENIVVCIISGKKNNDSETAWRGNAFLEFGLKHTDSRLLLQHCIDFYSFCIFVTQLNLVIQFFLLVLFLRVGFIKKPNLFINSLVGILQYI